MLPLTEIRAVHESVDDEWRSPVADAVAASWGIAPGVARYWRSSASHVFVVPPGADPRGVLYLRFVPGALRPREAIAAPAQLLAALGDDGGVVTPVRSLAGRLVETVPTPHGDVHAVVVPQALGAEVDVDSLTIEQATAWGAALARFHAAAAPHAGLIALSDGRRDAGSHEPRTADNAFAVLAKIATDQGDLVLARTAGRLAVEWDRAVEGLPGGVLHGDYELDNLRFDGAGVVAFDADETSIGPYAADIASAVRDLVGDEGTVDAPQHPALLGAFLDGYDSIRPLDDGERALLGLAHAHVAAQSLARGDKVLNGGDPLDPSWLIALRENIVRHHARARDVVLATGT